MNAYLASVLESVKTKHGNEPEFVQTVEEVLSSLEPVIEKHPEYEKVDLLGRMVEPERMFTFRVVWCDDNGQWHTNRGWRCQFNGAIGPYKGGLRFQKNVYEGIIKFLGFEQTFKNSLTGLPIGGAKGGSDFDPAGKSDAEVMRFCQSFMTELQRHIGPNVDVPAGDIGVGGREIGYLFGQYKRIRNEFTGVLTGKSLNWGGSLIRPEATGYGCVYFAQNMLATRNDGLQGKVCLVSGSGNVAQYTVEKLNELGAKAVTMSDSNGYVYDPDGISPEKLAWVMELKNKRRGRIAEYVKQFPKAQYFEGQRPWSVPCDCAFPSATQNEINGEDARTLIKNGCTLVAEGANMPTDLEGIETYLAAKILYGPAKAANAGGVATSGLEMSQNSQRLSWTREEVDHKLKTIMANIHANAVAHAQEYSSDKSFTNYVTGANIAGFVKVADSMIDQGVV